MADLPPLPPPPPIGRVRIVDEEGRATAELAAYLAKLTHHLGHITPIADNVPPEPPLPARSKLSLTDWLRANVS